jgi:hypothetical protein
MCFLFGQCFSFDENVHRVAVVDDVDDRFFIFNRFLFFNQGPTGICPGLLDAALQDGDQVHRLGRRFDLMHWRQVFISVRDPVLDQFFQNRIIKLILRLYS